MISSPGTRLLCVCVFAFGSQELSAILEARLEEKPPGHAIAPRKVSIDYSSENWKGL